MALRGVPYPSSVNDASNKYPGLVAGWEGVVDLDDLEHELFTVVVSGAFDVDRRDADRSIVEYVSSLRHFAYRWDIVHEFYPAEPLSKITFTMSYSKKPRYATLNSKMRVYKAAVELENFVLKQLLPLARGQFQIEVRALSLEDFRDTFVPSSDSVQDHTSEWLNLETMDRVHEWMTTVVPTFVRCWMPDAKVEAMEAYDAISRRTITGKQLLEFSDDNVLVMVSAPDRLASPSVGNRAAVAELRSSRQAIRHPCKVQVVSTNENPVVTASQTLQYTELVDVTAAFATTHQVFVRKDLITDKDRPANRNSRVFCIFPSFDEFPGLLSEEGRELAVGSLHCNPDRTDENGNLVGPPTVFKTSGIVQCPGEALSRTTADTCRPTEDVFRIRKDSCDEWYGRSYSDPTCCILNFGVRTSFASDMRVYGNRTVDRPREFLPVLNDAYEWFEREIGIEGPIVAHTETDDLFQQSYRLFEHFRPNCFTLEMGVTNADQIARAIKLMTFATKQELVYNAKLSVTLKAGLPIKAFFPLFQVFPKNTTEILLRPIGTVPSLSTITTLDNWISTQEHRQVDVVYSVVGEEKRLENQHSTRFNNVWRMMLSRGYRRVGLTSQSDVVQMRKDHVRLTIDWTTEREFERRTHLRYAVGARYTPRARTRPPA